MPVAPTTSYLDPVGEHAQPSYAGSYCSTRSTQLEFAGLPNQDDTFSSSSNNSFHGHFANTLTASVPNCSHPPVVVSINSPLCPYKIKYTPAMSSSVGLITRADPRPVPQVRSNFNHLHTNLLIASRSRAHTLPSSVGLVRPGPR